MEPLDAIGDSQLRATLLFVRSRNRPLTAADVARELRVPRSVARWRLEKLLAADLLVTSYERRSGRSGPGAGRPAKTYAPAAETSALEFPRRGYQTLVSLLANMLPPRGRAAGLRDVGVAFGKELAREARLRRGRRSSVSAAAWARSASMPPSSTSRRVPP